MGVALEGFVKIRMCDGYYAAYASDQRLPAQLRGAKIGNDYIGVISSGRNSAELRQGGPRHHSRLGNTVIVDKERVRFVG